ncbi:MAG: DUF4248 domain-containing protein [Bacteroides sp.]
MESRIVEERDDEEKFRIRCYAKAELAQMYAPGLSSSQAVKRLRRWILRCRGLYEALDGVGYITKCQRLTPKEVRLIVEYLGEP